LRRQEVEDLFGGATQAHAFGRDDERAVHQDRMRADRIEQRIVGDGRIAEAEIPIGRPRTRSGIQLDEVFLEIDGEMMYLWRGVDAEGDVLDVLVQSKRDKRDSIRLMRNLLKKCEMVPVRLVTVDLRFYGGGARDIGIESRHDRGKLKNNRAENSHQPTQRREMKMRRFKSAGSAQKFLSTLAAVFNTFSVQRRLT
jgi:putative transposase